MTYTKPGVERLKLLGTMRPTQSWCEDNPNSDKCIE
jgi:hypothetical protein